MRCRDVRSEGIYYMAKVNSFEYCSALCGWVVQTDMLVKCSNLHFPMEKNSVM